MPKTEEQVTGQEEEFNTNLDYWINRYTEMNGKNVVGRRDWNDEQFNEENAKWASKISPFLDQIQPTKILDFGCGIGRWVPLLTSYTKDYFGCDITDFATKLLKETFSEIPEKNISLLDNNNIPFGRNKFDLIWTCVVLQHVIDNNLLEYYLKQFHNRLKKGGHVICTENVLNAKNSAYMTFREIDEYQQFFVKAGFSFVDKTTFISSKEPHAVMLFKKE